MDVVDRATRSRMMAGIRSKNTKPEISIRRRLHGLGFRYRLHGRGLPGKPDIVLPRYGAVVFVHGCFWHGHDCRFFKEPKTRAEFWRAKIESNRANDRKHQATLMGKGWRVATVWECAVRKDADEAVARLVNWLRSTEPELDLREL
jgi:DNA mismatch endonuclease (patch repair protein)